MIKIKPDSPRLHLADHVYSTLKARIQDFQIVAGDRISEAELGLQLGMSRTPVREALFRLRNEGFIEVEPKLGWFVCPIDFKKLGDLYDLRIVLEVISVARLCERSDALDELEPLKQIWCVPAEERLTDARQIGAHDEEFHSILVHAAGNPETARVHWDLTERMRIVRRLDFTRQSRINATYDEHCQILYAITHRQSTEAQALIKSHIEHSLAQVRQITLEMVHNARPLRVY